MKEIKTTYVFCPSLFTSLSREGPISFTSLRIMTIYKSILEPFSKDSPDPVKLGNCKRSFLQHISPLFAFVFVFVLVFVFVQLCLSLALGR